MPTIKVPGRTPMAAVPNWVTFTPDSRQIYVSNAAHNSVSAIDTQRLQEIAVIGGRPGAQADRHTGDRLGT